MYVFYSWLIFYVWNYLSYFVYIIRFLYYPVFLAYFYYLLYIQRGTPRSGAPPSRGWVEPDKKRYCMQAKVQIDANIIVS